MKKVNLVIAVLLATIAVLSYTNLRTVKQKRIEHTLRVHAEDVQKETFKDWQDRAIQIQILQAQLTDWRTAKELGSIVIPMCEGIKVVVDKSYTPRPWGNGIEADFPDAAKIVYCDTLKQASPAAVVLH